MGGPVVFISYSHDDERWKDRLVEQLRVLEPEGRIEVWDDRRITAGDEWLPEIEEAMSRARVAVLLITASFLTSKFILGKEVPTLLERRQKDGLRVIPVIVKPCPWMKVGWLATLQCRPRDGRALSGGNAHEKDSVLSELALEINEQIAAPPHAEVERPAGNEVRALSEQRELERSTLAEPAEEINAPSTAPARVALHQPDKRWVRLPGLTRFPRLRFCVALVVLPLAAFLVSWRYRKGIEVPDQGFDCAPSSQQSPEKYDRYLGAATTSLAELDIPDARDEFNFALCARDLPAARIGFAKTLVALGQRGKARQVAATALGRGDQQERLQIEALAMAGAGKWEEALRRYQELLSRDPGNLEHIMDLAQTQIDAGKPQDALATVKAASAGSEPRIALIEARAAQETGDFQRALGAASRAIAAAGEKHRFIAAQGHLLRALALIYLHRTQEALGELDEAGKRTAENEVLLSDVLNNKGAILLDLGDFRGAWNAFKQASRDKSTKLGAGPLRAARSQQNLGIVYDAWGQLARARKNFEIALYELTSAGAFDDHPEVMADLENNLGLVLEDLGDLNGARDHLTIAIETYRKLHRDLDVAMGLCNRSQVWRLLLETETPRLDVKGCRDLVDHAGDKKTLADALAAEGDLALWQGDFVHAEERHKEALQLRRDIGDLGMIADTSLSLAAIELETGRPAAALASALEALSYYRDQKALDKAAIARVLLAKIQLAQQELPAARQNSERAEEQAKASELLELRVHSALTAASIAEAQGRINDAHKAAERALFATPDHPAFNLEALLVFGELRLRHPDGWQPNLGCEILEKVKDDARRAYGLVAQKADKILAGAKPPCHESN